MNCVDRWDGLGWQATGIRTDSDEAVRISILRTQINCSPFPLILDGFIVYCFIFILVFSLDTLLNLIDY